MRALVVTNMYPTPERPALGSFVRDQVEALRRRGDVEIELFAFPPGLGGYPRAARELRRRYGRKRFDVVHAHFGLTAWPAVAARLGPVVVTLHGNDLFDPRSNRLTRAILPFTALPAAVSREFSENLRRVYPFVTQADSAVGELFLNIAENIKAVGPPNPTRGGG
jgi:teichuronic acid biosynthesis glycosyltransferase TuaC